MEGKVTKRETGCDLHQRLIMVAVRGIFATSGAEVGLPGSRPYAHDLQSDTNFWFAATLPRCHATTLSHWLAATLPLRATTGRHPKGPMGRPNVRATDGATNRQNHRLGDQSRVSKVKISIALAFGWARVPVSYSNRHFTLPNSTRRPPPETRIAEPPNKIASRHTAQCGRGSLRSSEPDRSVSSGHANPLLATTASYLSFRVREGQF
jgi:hypothetical protein